MTKPHHVFPCARCGADINCWPHRAGKSVCRPCLTEVKRENGRRKTQTPDVGATRIRSFRGRRYVQRYQPDHLHAPKSGWMMEHRLVWEFVNGRLLDPTEVVHHIDHDGLNNAPDNLKRYASKGEHLAVEHSADGVAARLDAYPSCTQCGGRTQHGHSVCWPCWSQDATCPTCGREHRKMARRDMCHGCYKRHRSRPVPDTGIPENRSG